MSKHVHSKDPRKPKIISLLKEMTNCGRVTNVTEYKDHFSARCLVRMADKTWAPVDHPNADKDGIVDLPKWDGEDQINKERHPLEGLTVQEVRNATPEELKAAGFEDGQEMVVLQMNRGITIFALGDEEGNYPGTMAFGDERLKKQFYITP